MISQVKTYVTLKFFGVKQDIHHISAHQKRQNEQQEHHSLSKKFMDL